MTGADIILSTLSSSLSQVRRESIGKLWAAGQSWAGYHDRGGCHSLHPLLPQSDEKRDYWLVVSCWPELSWISWQGRMSFSPPSPPSVRWEEGLLASCELQARAEQDIMTGTDVILSTLSSSLSQVRRRIIGNLWAAGQHWARCHDRGKSFSLPSSLLSISWERGLFASCELQTGAEW